jgi:hypothetical protein
MTKSFLVIEKAEWEVKPNPVLKSELMIVRKDTKEIIASVNLANFLDYKFQAIWAFEAANYYPFLFPSVNFNLAVIVDITKSA